MPDWYRPQTSQNATDQQLLASWASDFGLDAFHLEAMSSDERTIVLRALKSLSAWFREPGRPDYKNPYWMEDEGYIEAEEDTKSLRDIGDRLLKRDAPPDT